METPLPATSVPVVLPPLLTQPKATKYEIASWLFITLGVVFILNEHLLSALLSALFVYALVHRITKRLTYVRWRGIKRKWSPC